MPVSVVCISRTLAAGGEPVGEAVAQRLGFRYVDEEVIARAAQKARITAQELATVERKSSVFKRVMEAIGMEPVDRKTMGGLLRPTMNFDYYGVRGLPTEVSSDHRVLIRQAIQEIAEEGQAVIVAHAASMALAERADVLRVLITGSPEIRAKRLKESSEREAGAAIAKDDDGRRDYLQRFYGVSRELPTHYDLVVNTDKLAPEQATAIVLAAAQASS